MKRSSWALLFLVLAGTSAVLFLFEKDKAQVIVSSQQIEKVPAQEMLIQENPSSLPESMPLRQARLPKSAPQGRVVDFKKAKIESVSWLAGTNWKLWTGVSARTKKNGPLPGKILGEVSGFYLVEDFAQHDPREFSLQEPLVVMDPRLDIAGVVTGFLSVILKEGTSAEDLANVPGLLIRDSFPDIRTYFVTAAEKTFDLQSLKDTLKSEPAVENVELEVLSRQYEKY